MNFDQWLANNRITFITYPGSLIHTKVGYQVLTTLQNVNLTKIMVTHDTGHYFAMGGNTNFPLIEFTSYSNVEKVLALQTGILIFDDSVELAKTMTNISSGTTWHTILGLPQLYIIILNTWGVDKLMYTELSRFSGGYLKLRLSEEEYAINLSQVPQEIELTAQQSQIFIARKQIELKDKSHKGKTHIKTSQIESFMYPTMIQQQLDINSQDKSIAPDDQIMTVAIMNTLNEYSPTMLALFRNIMANPTRKQIVRASLLNRHGIYLIARGLELMNVKSVIVEGKTSDARRISILDNFRKDPTLMVYITTVDIPDYLFNVHLVHIFNGISTYSYTNLAKYVFKIDNYSAPKPDIVVVFYIGVLHASVTKGLKAEIKNTPSLLLYRAVKNNNKAVDTAFENYLAASTVVELQ